MPSIYQSRHGYQTPPNRLHRHGSAYDYDGAYHRSIIASQLIGSDTTVTQRNDGGDQLRAQKATRSPQRPRLVGTHSEVKLVDCKHTQPPQRVGNPEPRRPKDHEHTASFQLVERRFTSAANKDTGTPSTYRTSCRQHRTTVPDSNSRPSVTKSTRRILALQVYVF